jgi:DNA-binding NarL/FixJ family response regulator
MKGSTKQRVFFVYCDPASLETMRKAFKILGVQGRYFLDSVECLRRLGSQRCDLLITDMEIPRIDGIELLRRVKLLRPYLPVLMISDCGQIATAVEAMKAGAENFILKPLCEDSLVHEIKLILSKNNVRADIRLGEPLTGSETRVLNLIADGKSSAEIAGLLNRSVRTIQQHRASLLRKLSVQSSIALVQRARRMGLIGVRSDPRESKTWPRDVR